jgi:DNA-binding transcriptional ArsR family regulator
LVVFDPILEFLAERVKEISSKSVRHALRPLISIADRTRCTFINVHHLNKDQKQSAAYRIADSHQFIAIYRAGFLVAKDPHDPLVRVAQPIKTSHAPEGAVPAWQFQLRNDEKRRVPVVNNLRVYSRGNADRMLNEEVRKKEATKTSEAEKFIRDIKNGATMAEIESLRASTSITKKTFDYALRRLKDAKAVETRPTGEGAQRALFRVPPGNSEKAK